MDRLTTSHGLIYRIHIHGPYLLYRKHFHLTLLLKIKNNHYRKRMVYQNGYCHTCGLTLGQQQLQLVLVGNAQYI